MRFFLLPTIVVVLVQASTLPAADKRPMTLDDFFAIKRVASPQISPDGKHVVYQVTTVDLEANKTSTALWTAKTSNEKSAQLLLDPKGKRDSNPRWSPDGKKILFESNRSGTSQLWTVSADGGEPRQVTTISTGATNGNWSPDGKSIAFVSSVYPEFSEKPFAESDKLNRQKEDEIAKNPVKARTFTKLFYRHWVEYVGDKRQHLFVCKIDGTDSRDVTPGDRDAFPTSTTFSSGDNFTFTPDSKHIVFTAPPAENEAWSTNYDLCRVSITNRSTKWETLTADNKAADSGPKFSPDGKKLAWRAQKRAGYEADKWDIVVSDCKPDGTLAGKPEPPTAKFDGSADELTWKDNDTIYFPSDDHGTKPIRKVSLTSMEVSYWAGGNPDVGMGSRSSVSVGRNGSIAYLYSRLDFPPEVVTEYVDLTGPVVVADVSKANESLIAQLDLPWSTVIGYPKNRGVAVEGKAEMQMWVVKPPGFDEKKKWPVVYLVHGGPQSAWRDGWNYRWNAQLWAAQGYVVVMPNPRGSVGFGQKFTDEITGDWGGKCYRDLVAGLDEVVKWPFVDKDRIAAAGGSFGGYMMNWFAVNDIAPRFKCLITHCSVWNFESMWGTTDELWFDEWEHGGLPWEKPQKYAEFSPHKKAGNLKKYKSPMLVIHNDLDFRCPIGQGHELFTALQRQGVPSRFVNFPDEGHHVLKPKNSEYWHKEVFAWFKKHAPPSPK